MVEGGGETYIEENDKGRMMLDRKEQQTEKKKRQKKRSQREKTNKQTNKQTVLC